MNNKFNFVDFRRTALTADCLEMDSRIDSVVELKQKLDNFHFTLQFFVILFTYVARH